MNAAESSPTEDEQYYVPVREPTRRATPRPVQVPVPVRQAPPAPLPAAAGGLSTIADDLAARGVHVHIHAAPAPPPATDQRRQGIENAPWWMGRRGATMTFMAIIAGIGVWAYLHFAARLL